jgi:hypothetical protein
LTSLALNGVGAVDPSKAGDSVFRVTSDGFVYIEVVAIQGQYNALKALLISLGMTDFIDNGPNTLIISGKFPIANLLQLPKYGTQPDDPAFPNLITFIMPLFPAIPTKVPASSGGDSAMHAGIARRGFGVTGSGIKVGVISDSYNSDPRNLAADDIANDRLPQAGVQMVPSQAIAEFPYGISTDEGRAMLGIVHDVAPNANLAFRTGFRSSGDFAQGILQLQQAGCDIIVDDVTYITEPFFQDGVVAKAVDQVKNLGVSYFSAAGNYGKNSYQSVFTPVTTPPAGVTIPAGTQAHNYGGGSVFQNISLKPGNYMVVLQWTDDIYSLGQTATGGTKNDLDIYLTDNNGQTLFGFNRNNIGGDPLKFCRL